MPEGLLVVSRTAGDAGEVADPAAGVAADAPGGVVAERVVSAPIRVVSRGMPLPVIIRCGTS